MDDTWNYDLMGLLRQAWAGQSAPLTDFLSRFAPLAATNADHSALLVLRRFDAASSQDQRRVLNCRPGGLNFQPGITITTYSDTGGAQSNAYLPMGFSYNGLQLRGQEVDLLRADAPALTTNITELLRKLNFWGTFAEDALRAAFGRLCNEYYAPRQPAAPAPDALEIELPSAGKLTYNSRYEWYEGKIVVDNQPVALTVAYVAPPQLTPQLAWVEQQLRARFWEPMLVAMTDQMLALKNETWLDDDEGEQELRKEEFQQRATISDVTFYADGSAAIYCDDDDMFFGHTIEIMVDKNGQYRTAQLAG
ncbi:DUF2262 domain-containing protein [Hymenobacter negativus]|uniref:DUF2262 domain-containing protein n=1 Tax=Hymenobacter negativus TaxID=2795026 RepID=A0ABS3QA57_9BACT|nr:DUF2262 domain-containing protein [Hymenobacter negativus]MBO2008086.1 DUF2262 domain-containing protein [Hymenobacter negativus]